MPILPRRFERLKSVLNCRMTDLTILLENIEKPHNLSAILRTCDAVGLLEANVVCKSTNTPTFNSTAQGSQKWVNLNKHENIEEAILHLKNQGFKIYGTDLSQNAKDYRSCDFKGPSVFLLGTEKWGMSQSATKLVDELIYIPMNGMVQSLNVSVAAAVLLFEALRQREECAIAPKSGEGIRSKEIYDKYLFQWAYPEVAEWCKKEGRSYPQLNSKGEILENLPRTIRLRY